MSFLSEFYKKKQQVMRQGWQPRPSPVPAPRENATENSRAAAFDWPGFSVIAEVKRASPSRGAIASHPLVPWAQGLERAGARMLSVLTEPLHFHGSLDVLDEVARHTTLPLLRKDFLLRPEELDEAQAFGASAVLLIVAFLPKTDLQLMFREARARGLGVLIEVHGEAELGTAFLLDDFRSASVMLGINQRDLESLRVDPRHAAKLVPHLPSETRFVVESGVKNVDDLRFARDLGARGVLCGEALSETADPGATLASWLTEL